MEKLFLKGNQAIAEAAVRAGCRFFAGYPITPQNEIPEHLSWRLAEVGGTFIQAESEVAASYMVFGAAMTGTRALTSSSGCGIALYTEGIGYMVGSRVPAVIINMARGGPGLGSILPAQQDYFAATKAPSNGGARCFVLAPSTIQEAVDMVYRAFDIADEYRCVAYILADGVIGNMMANVTLPEMRSMDTMPDKRDWIITGRNEDGSMRMITSCLVPTELTEVQNRFFASMYQEWQERLTEVECLGTEDAEVILTAYGTSARTALAVRAILREEGVRVGVIRPKTLFPFPSQAYEALDPEQIKKVICLEMSIPGQMVEDVRAHTDRRIPVLHYGRSGGALLKQEEACQAVRNMLREGT